MIQDAHPVRSGIPDNYRANLKINVVSSGATHTLDTTVLPPGFTAAFVSLGRTDITFPPGQKVFGAHASVDSKLTTAAQFSADVVNINETAGTASIIVTDRATPTLANPATGAVIYAELNMGTL